MEMSKLAALVVVGDRGEVPEGQQKSAEGEQKEQDAVRVLAQALHPQSCVCVES